jgi:hypothetical protein
MEYYLLSHSMCCPQIVCGDVSKQSFTTLRLRSYWRLLQPGVFGRTTELEKGYRSICASLSCWNTAFVLSSSATHECDETLCKLCADIDVHRLGVEVV